MIFPSSIAGSLPKPSWLAEPNKLWPQWKLAGEELAQAKLDAISDIERSLSERKPSAESRTP